MLNIHPYAVERRKIYRPRPLHTPAPTLTVPLPHGPGVLRRAGPSSQVALHSSVLDLLHGLLGSGPRAPEDRQRAKLCGDRLIAALAAAE